MIKIFRIEDVQSHTELPSAIKNRKAILPSLPSVSSLYELKLTL
jgi:hypothetical protein